VNWHRNFFENMSEIVRTKPNEMTTVCCSCKDLACRMLLLEQKSEATRGISYDGPVSVFSVELPSQKLTCFPSKMHSDGSHEENDELVYSFPRIVQENVRNMMVKPRIFPVRFLLRFITFSCSIIFHDVSSSIPPCSRHSQSLCCNEISLTAHFPTNVQ